MTKARWLLVGISAGMLMGCSRSISVNFQDDSAHTGRITLKPSRLTEKTCIMVNDRKILENGKVKSVTVNNLAGGSYLIRYASESDWYRDKLDVQLAVDLEEGKSVTRTIDVPPYGKGYWVHLAKRAMLILAVGMVLR